MLLSDAEKYLIRIAIDLLPLVKCLVCFTTFLDGAIIDQNNYYLNPFFAEPYARHNLELEKSGRKAATFSESRQSPIAHKHAAKKPTQKE